jgi:uncharacterized repeat protein (TIGR01451 family)
METRSRVTGLSRRFEWRVLVAALAVALWAVGSMVAAARHAALPHTETDVIRNDLFLEVTVNESHEWVEGDTVPGSTIVATVFRDGLPILDGTAFNDGDTHWHIEFGDQLRPGDVVEVETSQGLTASVEIIPMIASVDANADAVSGQLFGVPFPADVRVEVWTVDGAAIDAQTDLSGNYTIAFDGFDLLPGHMVFLAYVRPDGHRVGIVRHALRLGVDVGPDNIYGNTAPGALVTVTVNDAEIVTTTSDPEGAFRLQLEGDIVISDTVEASVGAHYTSLVVVPVTANLDEAADKVWGYGPPSAGLYDNLYVCVHDDCQNTSTDSLGYYEVTYDWNIAPGDPIEVWYTYPAGHETHYGFGPPEVTVNKWAPIHRIVPGDEFSYIIEYSNGASGPATDVVITDRLPQGVTYLWDTSGVSPDMGPGGNVLVWRLGSLGGFRSKSFELRARLDPSVPPEGRGLPNQVEISDPHDLDPGNNRSEVDIEPSGPWADLWVEKRMHAGLAVAGEVMVYRLHYGNSGSRAMADVVLTDRLPEGTTFEASTFEVGPDGLEENVGPGLVTWDIGVLDPGEEREFELAVRINPESAPGTLLINDLTISDDTGPQDTNRDNRYRLTTVVGQPVADLWVNKWVEGDVSSLDGDISYRIIYNNNGAIAAEDVVVTDTLPALMAHVSHSAGSAATLTDQAIAWRLGTVPPGSGGQLSLTARVTGPVSAGTFFTNTVEASTSTTESDDTGNRVEDYLGPPRVICVPWIGPQAHRVWSGLETTLKGTAKGYGLTSFEWDPGDGSPVITGSVEDPNVIEALHTYNAPVGTVFVAKLTVWGAFGWSGTDTYIVQIFDPIHGVMVDAAIDEGLWYLHKMADRYPRRGLGFAEWATGGYRVAETASAVQAFQVQGHRPGGDPWQDPYVEDVQRGWNALFTFSHLDALTPQPAGDPDGDADGAGIGMYDAYGSAIYESGLAMMALASTGSPDRVAHTGPPIYARGQTYGSIAQDMADWFAWGQNDPASGTARGGWRYQPNSGDSDNSNTQFPVLGLLAAEDNWGMTVPAWVKDELRDYWLAYTQNSNGGFGYMAPDDWVNVGKTGACIMSLAWTGVPVTDSRITSAAQFIASNWHNAPDGNWNGNVGEMYAMYAVKKGSQIAGIDSYGSHFWDHEYSSHLVGVQNPDGSFDDSGNFGNWQPLATSWALMILSPGLYEPLPVAIISPIPYGATEPEWNEGEVQFDGTASHHTDPERQLVLFEWDFGDGGTASSTQIPTHTYADNGTYTVTLTVTDDHDGMNRASLLLSVENVAPDVEAGANQVVQDESVLISLDPATFTDPGLADTHTATVDWGDDIAEAATVDQVAHTVSASHYYAAPGTYRVTVTVSDDDGGSGSDTFIVTVGRAHLYLPIITKGSG